MHDINWYFKKLEFYKTIPEALYIIYLLTLTLNVPTLNTYIIVLNIVCSWHHKCWKKEKVQDNENFKILKAKNIKRALR